MGRPTTAIIAFLRRLLRRVEADSSAASACAAEASASAAGSSNSEASSSNASAGSGEGARAMGVLHRGTNGAFGGSSPVSAVPVIVLIGRRDTGKSYLVRDLLYYHQDIPIGTVISGTEAGNGFYSEHVPKLFIHDEYNSAIIENILKRQKTVLKQIKKETEMYKKSNIDPRAFVILDDCLYDATWTRDKVIRLLFMNGRHWKIMLVITMQYPLGIPPN